MNLIMHEVFTCFFDFFFSIEFLKNGSCMLLKQIAKLLSKSMSQFSQTQTMGWKRALSICF